MGRPPTSDCGITLHRQVHETDGKWFGIEMIRAGQTAAELFRRMRAAYEQVNRPPVIAATSGATSPPPQHRQPVAMSAADAS